MAEFDDVPLRIGRVALTVHDLDRVARFYREAIGLHPISGDAGAARLGVGGTTLLELRQDAGARVATPREAGLFHTAFLLPTRAALGAWVRHALRTGLTLQGASDHVVSEALYLADPEGNGIEVYADRPRATWSWSGGAVVMRTDPLDLDGLVRDADAEPWAGVPAGTTVGHVHLQVGAIALAEAFYRDVLGLALTARYPGGSFYGSGGYHHHLATNVWNSRGAPPRDGPTTGLADVEIRAADAAALRSLADRAAGAGLAARPDARGLSLRDPWGTSLTVTGPLA